MGKLNQFNISQLCLNINNSNEKYLHSITNNVKDIVDWFNEYWISNFSKQIAEEIYQNLNIYTRDITNIFNDLDDKYKRLVNDYNRNPKNTTQIYYKGFYISKPNINNLTYLNKTLPDGKVGSLPKQTNMQYPINTIKTMVENITSILNSAIVNSDILTYFERKTLKWSITKAEIKLKDSLNEILKIIIEKEMLKPNNSNLNY